jgi:hypothetical protein
MADKKIESASPIKRLTLRREVLRDLRVRTGVQTGDLGSLPPSVPPVTSIPHSHTHSTGPVLPH